MKQPEKKNGVAFYEGNAWVHRVKLLQPDGSVKYSKRGGFHSDTKRKQVITDMRKNLRKRPEPIRWH